jgi:hypothetical protein
MGRQGEATTVPDNLDRKRCTDRVAAESPLQVIDGCNGDLADFRDQIPRLQPGIGGGGIRLHFDDPDRGWGYGGILDHLAALEPRGLSGYA